MKSISLNDLREFLLTLPDDAPIDMATGANDGCGCLMTQYGRFIGLKFDNASDVNCFRSNYSWMDGNLTVATILEQRSVFSLFLPWNSDTDSKENSKVAGYWKTRLK